MKTKRFILKFGGLMRRIDRIRATRQFGPRQCWGLPRCSRWLPGVPILGYLTPRSTWQGRGHSSNLLHGPQGRTRDHLGNMLSVLGNNGVTRWLPRKKRVAQIPSSAIWRVLGLRCISAESPEIERLKLNGRHLGEDNHFVGPFSRKLTFFDWLHVSFPVESCLNPCLRSTIVLWVISLPVDQDFQDFKSLNTSKISGHQFLPCPAACPHPSARPACPRWRSFRRPWHGRWTLWLCLSPASWRSPIYLGLPWPNTSRPCVQSLTDRISCSTYPDLQQLRLARITVNSSSPMPSFTGGPT